MLNDLDGPVVVAVIAMWVVQVAADHVVGVLAVESSGAPSDAVHARRLRRRREIGAARARADLQPIAALATRTDKRAASPKRQRGSVRA